MYLFIRFFCVCLFLLYANEFCFSQGNGSSGPLTVATGTTTIDNTATGVTGSNPISTTINVSSTAGFVAGDVVLVMQMLGTGAGSYDRLVISSVTLTSMTFTTSTTLAYSSVSTDRAQVIKIPQYTSVSLSAGATLTAPAWNGTTGGVFIFYSNTTASINGSITMNASGFGGGTGGAAGTGASALLISSLGGQTPGANGADATISPISPTNGGMASIGAGHGGTGGLAGTLAGITNSGTAGSGILGSNPSSGANSLLMGGGGNGGNGGQGGGFGGMGGGGGAASAISGPTNGKGFFGSSGGNGSTATGIGGNGGIGGGIILLYTNDFSGNGSFTANGGNGTAASGTGGKGGNGGNGGMGGSVNTGSPVNGGGGGGPGQGGRGGAGPNGGNGGAAGVIVVNENTSSWTGSMTSSPGTGGAGGAGGLAGTGGIGGSGGFGTSGGSSGLTPIGPVLSFSGTAGLTGSTGGASQAPLIIGPAPVELLNFNGMISNTKIILSWTTVSEKNNLMFTIEKSSNGKDFTTLDSVNGSVNSSAMLTYDILDLYPSIGNNYYRLKQKDIDGTTTFFNTIVVFYSGEKGAFVIFPNPTCEERIIYISGNERTEEPVNVLLYNNVQELVWAKENIRMNGTTFAVEFPSALSNGIYYISINTKSLSSKYRLFIK